MTMEFRAPKVKEDGREILELKVPLDILVQKVNQALKVKRVKLDLKGKRVWLGWQDEMELTGKREKLGVSGLQAAKEIQVTRDLMAILEMWVMEDRLENLERRVILVALGDLAPQAQMEYLDLRVKEEVLGHLDHLD